MDVSTAVDDLANRLRSLDAPFSGIENHADGDRYVVVAMDGETICILPSIALAGLKVFGSDCWLVRWLLRHTGTDTATLVGEIEAGWEVIK